MFTKSKLLTTKTRMKENKLQLGYFPNVILISGSGSNVGKTTLSCRLIDSFRNTGIVAVKVTPHWHEQDGDADILHQESNLLILNEKRWDSRKDSSRMLRSGAKKVFYVQNIVDEGLLRAFPIILSAAGQSVPMIVESAALGKFLQPACHFHIVRPGAKKHKLQNTEIPIDHIIHFDGEAFDFDLERISWKEGGWHIAPA